MSDLQRIKPIFEQALDREGRDRYAYLDEVCRSEPELRQKVEALLQAHEQAQDFLESPVFGAEISPGESPFSEGPGTVIGRYKLLEKIGEGGMAVVYLAEQTQPIRRKVALKIIKLGMDTRQVIARFEAERQALALMDHPSIAKVLDAGATETGRPYFVMELVQGVSITEYCDKNSLSTKDRLALFLQVCKAVQHAHQKGIIHRDIKPSNVMVTHHDGQPIPKVIDFGIAKATNQRLTERTLFTRYAHIIGTPTYMSPEQALVGANDCSPLPDIDTRSDIYSLGVLLYELLTGTTPFSEEELRKAGYFEMPRVIREQEPVKPSTRLSTLGETLAAVAKHRNSTPDLLRKAVRGDLDWIVMKSLEKDRVGRYGTASCFALDIERHLDHRPVAAHAPSIAYRLRKTVRRNRVQILITLAIMAAAGAVVVLLQGEYRDRLGEAQDARHVNALPEARRLIAARDLAAAREVLVPILESRRVGLEARILFAQITSDDSQEVSSQTKAVMNRHYRERVAHYSARIQTDPADPSNYLQRAHYHRCLHDDEQVLADMDRYVAILDLRETTSPHDRRFRHMLASLWRGTPVNLGDTVNSPSNDSGPCVSADHLSLLFTSNRLQGPGSDGDLWLSTRPSPSDPWETPVNLGPTVNSDALDAFPALSADGLSLFFASDRSGGQGGWDLWVTTRPTLSDPWDPPVNLGAPVNSPTQDFGPSISGDGLSLFFASRRQGGFGRDDIYMSRRPTPRDPWGDPINLGPAINGPLDDGYPSISADGLWLFFSSMGKGGAGQGGIWVTRRISRDSNDWGTPLNLSVSVNIPYAELSPHLSADGSTFYFCSYRPGGRGVGDLWQIPIPPLRDSPQDEDKPDPTGKRIDDDKGKEVGPER